MLSVFMYTILKLIIVFLRLFVCLHYLLNYPKGGLTRSTSSETRKSPWCKMEKFWTKMDEICAEMRSKISSKLHRNSRKFWTKLNEFWSSIFANFVQRKFYWNPNFNKVFRYYLNSYLSIRKVYCSKSLFLRNSTDLRKMAVARRFERRFWFWIYLWHPVINLLQQDIIFETISQKSPIPVILSRF